MNRKEILISYQNQKRELLSFFKKKDIKGLYKPMSYIFSSDGKSLRPFFLIFIYKLYGGRKKNINTIALAVQALHNFTLIHDDIMDGSKERRGNVTIHQKWDLNTGILSGDALMIYSYNLLFSANLDQEKKLVRLFSKTAISICEGQELDLFLQKKRKVTIEDYIKMINLKTGALFSFSFQTGCLLAGSSVFEQKKMCKIGILLGQLFQIQDDFLDLYGGKKMGKPKGLDILQKKKTYLVINFYKVASSQDIKRFDDLFYSNSSFDKRLVLIEGLLNVYKIKERALAEVHNLIHKINLVIDKALISENKKKQFKDHIKLLSNRSY